MTQPLLDSVDIRLIIHTYGSITASFWIFLVNKSPIQIFVNIESIEVIHVSVINLQL